MYLVLPALFFLARRRLSVLYLGALFLTFCALGFIISSRTSHLNMAAYVPCFICGVLCYALRDRIRTFVPAFLWPPFVLLLISGYCLSNLRGEPNFWIGWIYCLILGVSINAFHDSTNKPLDVIAQRGALYSYGMYLLHVPVLYLVFVVLAIKNLSFGISLFFVLTVIASTITYHFIEAPLIEVGRKVSSPKTRVASLA